MPSTSSSRILRALLERGQSFLIVFTARALRFFLCLLRPIGTFAGSVSAASRISSDVHMLSRSSRRVRARSARIALNKSMLRKLTSYSAGSDGVLRLFCIVWPPRLAGGAWRSAFAARTSPTSYIAGVA